MKNPENPEKLFSEFPPVSRREWERVIKSDLNADNYTSVLKWNTLEGIEPHPFYMREDSISRSIFNTTVISPGWHYTEPIFDSAPDQIRSSIQKALQRDADSIRITSRFRFDPGSASSAVSGSLISDQKEFDRIFEKTESESLIVMFDTGMASPVFAAMTENHPKKFKKAAFIFDPVTETIKNGRIPWKDSEELKKMIGSIAALDNSYGPAADALYYHNAGCTIVSETAFTIALAAEYLAIAGTENRETVAKSFFARVSAGPLYFPEIAKFRAIRVLWKTLLRAYKLNPEIPLFIHAETTSQNKTVSDPHNNMLRATTEAMAAIIGGTNSLVVGPFDESFNEPGDFSRRISGNVHHILREEAHLGKCSDPGSGCYYIEELTRLIADEAWKIFKEIEEKGGFLESIRNGFVQEMVRDSREQKENAYATRKRTLTGTNNYPNPDEEFRMETDSAFRVHSLQLSGSDVTLNTGNLMENLQKHLKNGTGAYDLCKIWITDTGESIETLHEFNAGEIFDSIRRQTHHLRQKTGKSTDVLIIPAGNLKWRNARASFSENLIGCGGFDINIVRGTDTIHEALSNLENEKPAAAVLCSSDHEYPEMAEAFCKAFDNDTILILAGNPGENEELFRKTGIDGFIHSGINAVQVLKWLQTGIFSEEVS